MFYLVQDTVEIFEDSIELNERYFGGASKGKHDRGASDKVIMFGLLRRHGKVKTIIEPDTKSTNLMPVITKKITTDSIVYTVHWHAAMLSMLPILAIIESIIQTILMGVKIKSMVLNFFGIRVNIMVFTEMPFHCLLRNVSLDLTMVVQNNSLKTY